MTDISNLKRFLGCPTPKAWLDRAVEELPTLIVDHANCEKKAAATAMNLLYRYIDKPELLRMLSQLAREELLHFEQVLEIMSERSIEYVAVSPGRYAGGLRKPVRTHEPAKLVDTLIVGAIIEARSCERFEALAGLVDEPLGNYYRYLLKSESRHYEDYLSLARLYADQPIEERIEFFVEREVGLIESPDPQFRFHSGAPQ
ncbi:MAG: tRNA-(ms[2]io[6]A)-hydroxylase [Moraxellaceae bacterium]|nr:MAG: tRNA-(ms[2]io[6]A)-hydroxylase [Moraxellaceae bacterium]